VITAHEDNTLALPADTEAGHIGKTFKMSRTRRYRCQEAAASNMVRNGEVVPPSLSRADHGVWRVPRATQQGPGGALATSKFDSFCSHQKHNNYTMKIHN